MVNRIAPLACSESDHPADLASDAFERFALTAEQIAATPKRLTKAALLGDYFAALSDADLRLAARYFAGAPFPQFDQRVLQVGGLLYWPRLAPSAPCRWPPYRPNWSDLETWEMWRPAIP